MSQQKQGLSSAEAARRLAANGSNELPGKGPRGIAAIIVDVVTEPMFLLLLAAAGTYLLLGSLREALVLLASVIVIIVTTVFQERRTEHTLARLRDLTSPRALVIRDGNPVRIPSADVVVGDLFMLQEGDRVPADGIVVSATALSVDESILTGESLPVAKSATERVYSGSVIVGGHGIAEVVAIGSHTEIGKIGRALESLTPEVTPLNREVNHLARTIAIAGVLLCAAIALIYAVTRHDWLAGILAGITVAMGVLPEEFPVVLTVFLAMGAWRISKHRVLVRRMPAIETIGAVTVLAVDKTGTLTENRMRVAIVDTLTAAFDLRSSHQALDASARTLLGIAAAASERNAFDPMEHAVHDAAANLTGEEDRFATATLVREYDLTPELLAVTHVWQRSSSDSFEIAMKGAPETVFDLCGIDAAQREALLTRVTEYAQQGLRVLAVARGSHHHGAMPDSPHAFDVQLLGLLCLADPIRATVPDALADCKRAGIRVVMITGDHVGTALAIATQASLDTSGGAINCAELNALSDEQLQERARHVGIYARATPQHKLRLVEAFKANGDIIAMTGDGVNDAPALKAAHVGVAMGSRGTDVAREAAALILLDDEFASLVRAVRLGRRIYSNIQHAMYYIVAVHIPIAGMGLLPVLFGWPLVLYPLHVLFLEFVIDPACSLMFEADPEAHDIMSRPPRAPTVQMFSQRSLRGSIVLGVFSFAYSTLVYYLGLKLLDAAQARGLAFSALVLGSIVLMTLSRARSEALRQILRRPNPAFWGIVVLSIGALAVTLYVPAAASLFRFSRPPAMSIAIVVGVAVLGIVVNELWRTVASATTHKA